MTRHSTGAAVVSRGRDGAPAVDVADHIDQLEVDGPLLAAAAARAGWDAPVPGTDWVVRDLVVHTGGVHRWATDAIRRSLATDEAGGSAAFRTDLPDDDVLDWFVDGHASLVATLRAADPDLQAFTFLPADSPLHFWARRQAHETAIHRADAQAAAGETPDVGTDFAQDGIAELVHGFAARRSNAIDRAATIVLRPTDGGAPWRLTLGGERIVAERDAPAGWANALVRGSSADLYLWLWNRPSGAVVRGDQAVADLWRTVRVR